MKYLLKIIALVVMASFVSCGDEETKPSEKAVKTKILTATSWGHAQVTHTDGDLSDQYNEFAILFTNNKSAGFDGTFIVSNGGNAFAENSGKWKFNEDLTKIIFDSGKELDITIEEEFLQFDFIVADPAGRVAGLSGHFIFDLQPL